MPERTSSSHDYEHQSDDPTLENQVDALLSDELIQDLSEDEQGKLIIDQFVGVLMRKGDIHGTNDSYSPREALSMIDDASNLAHKDSAWIQTITRTDGLRLAAYKLAGDERTGKFFGNLANLVEKDITDKNVLSNMAQVKGYLYGEPNANTISLEMNNGSRIEGTGWIDVLEDRMNTVIEKDGHWINDPRRGLIESDNAFLRQQGSIWLKAVNSAKDAGVDVDLLGRSAEYIALKNRIQENRQKTVAGKALEQMQQADATDRLLRE